MMRTVRTFNDFAIVEASPRTFNKFIVVGIKGNIPLDRCQTYEDAYSKAVWRQEEITVTIPPRKWARNYLLDVGKYHIVRTVKLSGTDLAWTYHVMTRQEDKVYETATYPDAVRMAIELDKEVSTNVEEK